MQYLVCVYFKKQGLNKETSYLKYINYEYTCILLILILGKYKSSEDIRWEIEEIEKKRAIGLFLFDSNDALTQISNFLKATTKFVFI